MAREFVDVKQRLSLCHTGLVEDLGGHLVHRFSKCSVRSPRALWEKPRGSASYSFTYKNTELANFATA